MRRPLLALILAAAAAALAACAATPLPPLAAADGRPFDILLLGEQHDAPRHQELHRQVVTALAQRGALGALVLEMAERPHSTAGLPRDATEAQVRQALGWEQSGWPWPAYAPAVMAAVAAGVPVLGGNLPHSKMRQVMADGRFDLMLPGPALKAQQQAVRQGHCDMLPEQQVTPMTRIQIARDESMAQTLAQAVVPGKTVVLLAGGGHVDGQLGVPMHLPHALRVEATRWPPEPPKKDYCAEFEAQMRSHGAMRRTP
jgi:uncharacterized iron-regulated protein